MKLEANMATLPVHLDIHLIRILYMLLCEKNVSRVAKKLNQPQPSISASLRKLRELTGDPLMVRGARGMVLTEHAESLLQTAKEVLDATDRLFTQKIPFAPAVEGRTFHIAAPDYLDSQFLPNIVANICRESPLSRVVIHGLSPEIDYVRLMADGELDLVISNWDGMPPHLHISKLFEDELACIMRADSPYALQTGSDDMTMEDYLSLMHIAPSQMVPGYCGVVESFLASQNLKRKVAVESAYFGLIPYILTRTDFVLTTGRQFMSQWEKTLPLKSFALPIRFPQMRFHQMWHERAHHSPEHKWLREVVRATTKSLTEKDASITRLPARTTVLRQEPGYREHRFAL
jgi:DNA-binding transcriptional LysR family regulator